MTLLRDLRVHDAGTSVATAHAARLLGALGAVVTSSNPARPLLDDPRVLPSDAAGPVDVELADEGCAPGGHPLRVSVHVDAAGGEPHAAERRLQAGWGLAWLCGEPEGPPLLTGGWLALLHAGAQAAVAALLGLLAANGDEPLALHVDARGATASLLDDALVRAARGLPQRPRTRGPARLEAAGRLARAHDGWVSLSLSQPGEWAALDALAGADGIRDGRPASGGLTAAARRWIARRSRRQVFDALQEMRLPCGMALTPAEAIADPLLRSRGVVDGDGGIHPFRCDLADGPAPRRARGRRPLDGVRVVELGALWAGPAATMLLAEWGADVDKVEGPHRLDGFREAGGTRFAAFNRGKRSVVLDPADAAGHERLCRLLTEADVLVEANSPRVLQNWGLDTAALRRLNPGLIAVHLPALGAGPTGWPQPVAYGFDVEMLAGQAVTAADAPVRPCGVPLGDPVTAMAAAAAVLAALWRRRLDGCVAHVELAQRDALLHQLAPRCAAARRGERWPADHLAGEPAHDARTPEAVLNDPRLRQGGGLIDVVDEDGVVRPYPTAAIRFVGGPEPLARPAPAPETKTGERRELSAALPAR